MPPRVGRGEAAALQLTPTRVIAPVGSEVVLLSGLCGGDGFFVTGQPVEWLLSQDSAGHFVEVGSENRPCWRRMLGRAPKKVSGSYAKGRTSGVAEVITRGTADPNDDVWQLRGQTWISVTSASEGTSKVTCLAPQIDNWDHRTQTATVHWIDAQWVLPPPVVGRAGQTHTLATTITRCTSPAPVVGWIVRYEVVDGPPAGFGPQGAPAAEVVTDTFGKAALQIFNQAPQPGVTRVRVQIIRPPAPGDGLARQVVGEGFTSVTWSASGLAVRIAGPDMAEVDSTATYQIEVSNPGDLSAKDVLVTDELPAGMSLVSSTPAGRVFGNRVEWQLGELGPRQSAQLTLECRIRAPGDITHCVQARSGENSFAEHCTTTRVVSNALDLKLEGPPTARVGEKVLFKITVTNRGRQRLTGVRLIDTYDPGLQHAEPSPIDRQLGDLAPGQAQEVGVTFTILQAGQLCHTLQVTADGGHATAKRVCLTATAPPARPAPQVREEPQPAAPQPRPAFEVSKKAPKHSRVGEEIDFEVVVTNTGRVPLEDVRITDQYADSLKPIAATEGHTITSNGQVTWRISQVLPGQYIKIQVRCKCVDADRSACSRVTVAVKNGLPMADEACLEIFLPPRPPEPEADDGGAELGPPTIEPPVPPANGRVEEPTEDQPRVAGELRLTVAALGDPIKVGETTSFAVTLENNRQVPDKNIRLTLVVQPAGVELQKVDGPVQPFSSGAGKRMIRLQPIAEIRAREKLNFMVTVVARQAGKYQFQVTAESLRTPEPLTVEDGLTVNVE